MLPPRPSPHRLRRLTVALAGGLLLSAATPPLAATMTQEEMEAYVARLNQSLQEQHEAQKRYEQSIRARALWSTDEACTANDAGYFEIVVFADGWQIAGCAPYGCRIAVKDFPGRQTVAFDADARIAHESARRIRVKLHGEMRTLHRCPDRPTTPR